MQTLHHTDLFSALPPQDLQLLAMIVFTLAALMLLAVSIDAGGNTGKSARLYEGYAARCTACRPAIGPVMTSLGGGGSDTTTTRPVCNEFVMLRH